MSPLYPVSLDEVGGAHVSSPIWGGGNCWLLREAVVRGSHTTIPKAARTPSLPPGPARALTGAMQGNRPQSCGRKGSPKPAARG